MVSDLEEALEKKDWSPLYSMNDPNEATALFLNLVTEALDSVAPLKAIKIRPDKPKISLRKDNLAAMASRGKQEREAIT